MYIYPIHLFEYLFKIQLQRIIGNILLNLWQRRLEKPLLCKGTQMAKTENYLQVRIFQADMHEMRAFHRSSVVASSHQFPR